MEVPKYTVYFRLKGLPVITIIMVLNDHDKAYKLAGFLNEGDYFDALVLVDTTVNVSNHIKQLKGI